MNKELIQKRFGRKLNLYNENAHIQKQMANKLMSMIESSLQNKKNKIVSVLEIGCGTGLLTELAVNRLNYSDYIAVDIVSKCESYIKNINPDIEFISNDAEKFIDTTERTFDLIISNASLQWISNLPEFINKLTNKLNVNGQLLFSAFGKENYREIYYILGKTLPYLSKRELECTLSNHTPFIEEEVRIMAFKTPKDVLKHIQNTGVNAISSETWTKKDLIDFENGYHALSPNRPTLTYNPIYVVIKK